MNFSLLIVFIVIAVVLPVLCWRFFSTQKNNYAGQNYYIDPSIDSLNSLTDINKQNPPQTQIAHQKLDYWNHAIDLGQIINYKNNSTENLKQNINNNNLNYLSGSHIIKIYAVNNKLLRSYELLQALQNAGLVYDENFFHYIYPEGSNHIILTCMRATVPHEFNLDEIGACETEGLILVLRDNTALEAMKDIAQLLAEELGGEISYESPHSHSDTDTRITEKN